MEKIKKVPENIFVTNVDFETSERFYDSYVATVYGGKKTKFIDPNHRVTAKVTLSIEITSDEDWKFVWMLKDKGIHVLLDAGFDVEKLKYVINQGMVRLPILLKHEDPDIAQIAFILSKYFAQRNDIMPEKVVE